MRALILNMPDRLDRYEKTIAAYPSCLPEPERYIGITAEEVEIPNWWKSSDIYASNRQNFIDLFDIASKEKDYTFIFEDDVTFCDDFEAKLKTFLDEVPEDWDVLYLGGQHIAKSLYPPIQISEHILRCFCTIRTHAMIARPETAGKIRDWLAADNWGCLHIADNRMAQYMLDEDHYIYSPIRFICGQRGNEKSTQCFYTFSKDTYFNKFKYRDLTGKVVHTDKVNE